MLYFGNFQGPFCLLTIRVNLYFISTVYMVDDLHSMEFFLVTVQSLFDLVFNGLFILIHYVLDTWIVISSFCLAGSFLHKQPHEYFLYFHLSP